MNDGRIETIEIPGDPDHRIVVYPDSDAQNPRKDIAMLTGYVGITDRQSHHNYIDVEPVHGDSMDLFKAYEHFDGVSWSLSFDEGYRRTKGWEEKPEHYVIRYARIFHGAVVEWDGKYGGFWFVNLNPNDPDGFAANWPELVLHSPEHLAKQAEVIKQDREVYRQWAEGEVYGVVLEQRHERARVERDADGLVKLLNPLTDDDIFEEWEQVESIWGCFLGDEYTAVVAAKYYFDIPALDKQEQS